MKAKRWEFWCFIGILWGLLTGCAVDKEPPVVAITSPTDGANIKEPIFITAEVTDNLGIDYVDCLIDGESIGVLRKEPFRYYWNIWYWLDRQNHIISIRAVDNKGNETVSVPVEVRLVPDSVLKPQILEPGNGYVFLIDEPLEVRWESFPDAILYQLQIDNVSSFSSPAVDTLVNDTSAVLGYLSGGQYYLRLRALDQHNHGSSWTETLRFAVSGIFPPSLISPADSTVFIGENDVLFQWQRVPGSILYWLKIFSDSSFSTLYYSTQVADTALLLEDLPIGEYYWEVRAQDTLNTWTASSGIWYFRIQGLTPPALIQPQDSTVFRNTRDVSFEWSLDEMAANYTLEVARDTLFNYIYREVILQSNKIVLYDFDQGRYYWRVRNRSQGGVDSDWSDFYSFEVTGPEAPLLFSPRPDTVLPTNTLLIRWRSVLFAENYKIELSTDTAFTNADLSFETPDTFLQVSNLEESFYYLRISSQNAFGFWGEWSDTVRFHSGYVFNLSLDFGGDEWGGDAVALPDESLIVVGGMGLITDDDGVYLILRVNPAGELEWYQSGAGRGYGKLWAVDRSEDGAILAGGEIISSSGDKDLLVLKYDDQGNEIWSRTFGGDGDDFCRDILALPGGEMLLVGENATTDSGGGDGWMLKLDSQGNLLWEVITGGVLKDQLNSVVIGDDGDYLAAGFSYSSSQGDEDAWIIRVDQDGNVLLDTTYGTTGSEGLQSLLISDDGYFMAAGYTDYNSSGSFDFYVVKFSQDGELIWNRKYGTDGEERADGIAQMEDGNYIVLGEHLSASNNGSDAFLVKIDPAGNTLWNRYLATEQTERVVKASAINMNNFFLTGYKWSPENSNFDLWLVRVDKNGETVK